MRIISAQKAAKLLGVDQRTVAERLRNGIWTFGRAIPPEQSGKRYWTYEVYVDLLQNYLRGE